MYEALESRQPLLGVCQTGVPAIYKSFYDQVAQRKTIAATILDKLLE